MGPASPSPRPQPRIHWLVLVAVLLAVTTLVLAAAVADRPLAERRDGAALGSGPAPAALLSGGPLLQVDALDQPGAAARPGTVALTFDDGPGDDTRAVLDALARHDVRATFFFVGSRIARHPDLVEDAVAAGHEVGIHTFTHTDLADAPAWLARLEVNETQLVLAAATGRRTDLIRLPYTSTPAALSQADVRTMTQLGPYRFVLADLDTRDWDVTDADVVQAAATPRGGAGAVVRLHDGGGDRSATVEALDRLIPALKEQGYTFDTVTGVTGTGSALSSASATERFRGHVLVAALWLGRALTSVLGAAVALALVLALVRAVLVLRYARRHARRVDRRQRAAYDPPVSVVVPVRNAAQTIGATVASVAASTYRRLEVVVVDDGSTDGTSEVVEALGLANVHLVRRGRQGTAAAVDAGVAAAAGDIIVLAAAGTTVEPDAVGRLARGLADPTVGAVSGRTRVAGRRGPATALRHVELVAGPGLDRRLFDHLECLPRVPGALTAFRREVLLEAGGLTDDTLAEDVDVTMRIVRGGWRVAYEPSALVHAPEPVSPAQWWRQRHRQSYGTLQAMWKHRSAAGDGGPARSLGRRGLPYLLLVNLALPLLAPVVDLLALVSLVVAPSWWVLAAWVGLTGLQLSVALYAFSLDREPARPVWAVVVHPVVHRQLAFLVAVQSLASALYGDRLRRHRLGREMRSGSDDALTGPAA